MDRLSRIALGGIGVSIAVLALKALAWWVTRSAALYADALESIVNVVAAGMALWAVRLSALPPDRNHPFGHTKVELFAAMAEGGMIVAAAVLILQQAYGAWRLPSEPRAPLFGIGINVVGSVLNAAWAARLIGAGHRLRSPALAADGRHLAADVATSGAVVTGVALVAITGIARLDAALAAAVAVYILWTGSVLARQSAAGLMDEAPPDWVTRRIEALLSRHGEGALQVHDIRMRLAGRQTFLQFHLVVPAGMTVLRAHDICDRIEAGILADLPDMVTTIHVEPEGKAKADGALVL